MRVFNASFKSHEKAQACQQAHMLRTRHWEGPNVWSAHPVFEASLLDMDDHQWPQLESSLRALLQAIGLPARICSTAPHYNGRGTVVLEASDAALGRVVLQQALEQLYLTLEQRAQHWPLALARIRHTVDEECLGPSTACIANAALQRHLPAFRLFPKGNLVQLGMGAAQQRIWTAESDGTSAIGQDIAANKSLTKRLLGYAGIPTPQGELAASPAQAWQMAQNMGLPVVVKPLDGNRARGVSLDLSDQASIEAAWYLAKREGSQVMVERYIVGDEHRILVVGQKVIAATRGETLSVRGDGCANIEQLVEAQINQHPRCLVDMTIERIELGRNAKVLAELKRQGMTPQSIPAAGEQVVLLRTGNLTVDCTDEVHPDIAHHAIMAARTIGLNIAGIDLVVQDIRQPLLAQQGAIVEVNAGPSLLMHLHPVHGQARAVGEAICQHLFPQPDDGRIPLTAVLASEAAGKRIAHALSAWQQSLGLCVGCASAQHMWVEGSLLPLSKNAAPSAAQRVLMHRAVQAAVLAQDMQQCLEWGWPYSQCDLAIIHPHASDMEPALQQRVLAAQIASVRQGGSAIVVPGSPSLESLALTCLGNVVWVHPDEFHPILQAHRRVQGGIAFVRDQRVVCARGAQEWHLPLPAALGDWELHEWLSVAAAGWLHDWPLAVLDVMAQQTSSQ
ncbi:MAG: acetate--CoA ligase family protein [Comamonas sp.]